jgi:hypothetical protein
MEAFLHAHEPEAIVCHVRIEPAAVIDDGEMQEIVSAL